MADQFLRRVIAEQGQEGLVGIQDDALAGQQDGDGAFFDEGAEARLTGLQPGFGLHTRSDVEAKHGHLPDTAVRVQKGIKRMQEGAPGALIFKLDRLAGAQGFLKFDAAGGGDIRRHQRENIFLQELFLGDVHAAQQRGIGHNAGAIRFDQEDGFGERFDQRALQLFGVAQAVLGDGGGLLGLLAAGDVDERGAALQVVAVRVVHGDGVDQAYQQAAIPAHDLKLGVDQPALGHKTRKSLFKARTAGGGEQLAVGFDAHQLGAGVAQPVQLGLVDQDDDPVFIQGVVTDGGVFVQVQRLGGALGHAPL